MPKNRIIFVFVALSVALIMAGIWITGGPAAGQAERRDAGRLSDLYKLQDLTFCLAETAGGVLPDEINTSETCKREIDLIDAQSGQAYKYQRISDRSYLWCAPFEAPDRIQMFGESRLDVETGCVQFTYRP